MIARLLTLGALVLLLPATAAAKPSCSSGKTLFKQGRTRIFQSHDRTEWSICSARLKRPHVFAYGNDGSLDDLYLFRAFGRRVAYAWDWVGGDDLGWAAGWVDSTTGQEHNVNVDPQSDMPEGDPQAVVAGADGSVAFVEKTSLPGVAQAIGAARYGTRKLHEARLLATIETADVVPESLAVAGGMITWTTTSGVPGSAALK